jgi:hypothetical protein
MSSKTSTKPATSSANKKNNKVAKATRSRKHSVQKHSVQGNQPTITKFFVPIEKDAEEKNAQPEVAVTKTLTFLETIGLIDNTMKFVAYERRQGLDCDEVHKKCSNEFDANPTLKTIVLADIDIKLIPADRLFPVLEVMYMFTPEFKAKTNHTDSMKHWGKWIHDNHPYAWDDLKEPETSTDESLDSSP